MHIIGNISIALGLSAVAVSPLLLYKGKDPEQYKTSGVKRCLELERGHSWREEKEELDTSYLAIWKGKGRIEDIRRFDKLADIISGEMETHFGEYRQLLSDPVVAQNLAEYRRTSNYKNFGVQCLFVGSFVAGHGKFSKWCAK